MRLYFTHRAGPDERFDPAAFGRQVGKVVDVHVGNGMTRGTVTDVQVSDDRRRAEITMNLDHDTDRIVIDGPWLLGDCSTEPGHS